MDAQAGEYGNDERERRLDYADGALKKSLIRVSGRSVAD